jgi:hypothetical protein
MSYLSSVMTRSDRVRRRPDTHALAIALIGTAVLFASVVVVASAVSTSSARVTASTSSDGLLTAGNVVLTRPDDSVSLRLDGSDLHPGRTVHGCFVLEYAGSVPADVRLYGVESGGTGLGAYVDVVLTAVESDGCAPDSPESDADATTQIGEVLYRGRLGRMAAAHATYADGVEIMSSMVAGDRLVVEAVVEVADDNRAQGLTVDFSLVFEARPT